MVACVPHNRAVNLEPSSLQHFHHPLDTEPADLESSHGINDTLVHRNQSRHAWRLLQHGALGRLKDVFSMS